MFILVCSEWACLSDLAQVFFFLQGVDRILLISLLSGVPRKFVRGGVQQIQLRTEDRENGNLGAVVP